MVALQKLISAINIGKRSNLKSITLKLKPSKLIKNFLSILFEEGFLKNYSFLKNNLIKIEFRFSEAGTNIISTVTFLGSNSKFTTISTKFLWKKERGQGVFILSTPKGLITDLEARNLNVGGKVIAIIV